MVKKKLIFQHKLLPIIAITGSEDSGKSTLCQALSCWLTKYYPDKTCYLRNQTENIILTLPIFKKLYDRANLLVANNEKKTSICETKFFTALILFMCSLNHSLCFFKMLRLQKKGYLIVTDHYPHTSIYDRSNWPVLRVENPKNIITLYLTNWERQLYTWMSRYKPSLVIRINFDNETTSTNKSEHCLGNVSIPKNLSFFPTSNETPILELYCHKQSLDTMITEAKKAIINLLSI